MNNPYAPPKDLANNIFISNISQDESGLTVEGDLVVAPTDHQWPDRCVVCNAPAEGTKLTKRLYWHSQWIYILVLFNWLIYLIVALVVRKNAIVHIGLCPIHRRRRKKGLIVLWLGFPLSFISMIVGSILLTTDTPMMGVLFAVGLIGMLGCPIVAAIMIKTVVPKRIHQNTIWLKTGRPFKDSL